jgi:hypothetical protein
MTTGFVFGGMAQEQYQKRGKDLKKLEEKQILLHEEGEGNLLYLLVDQTITFSDGQHSSECRTIQSSSGFQWVQNNQCS